VPAPAPGCNPATPRPVGKAPPPTQSRSAARPLHPHRHPQRRYPAPAIRILSAVEQVPAATPIRAILAAVVNPNTFPASAGPAHSQRAATLMGNGNGMMHAPLNVAPLVAR